LQVIIFSNPLSNFPQGGKVVLLLPLWGKVGKGVKIQTGHVCSKEKSQRFRKLQYLREGIQICQVIYLETGIQIIFLFPYMFVPQVSDQLETWLCQTSET
jgi:hypothetical protein